MGVTAIADLAVRPKNVDELISVFKELLPVTRKYEGCLGIELHRNQDDSNNLILIQEWRTREHHEKYIAWRTETGVMDQVGAYLIRPPGFRYFDHIETM